MFSGDKHHKYAMFSGDKHHKYAMFSGDKHHKYAMFSGDKHHKYAMFSGDKHHKYAMFSGEGILATKRRGIDPIIHVYAYVPLQCKNGLKYGRNVMHTN